MGEAYKGLTIQIGADTTKLTAALRNVNKAALSTQRAIKRIDSGLSKDPANLSLMSAKLADLAERSGVVAVKMRLMREQMAQMKGSGIEKALDSTKNLALRAASASDEYARLVRQISEVRTAAATDWGWSQSEINDPNRKDEIDQRIAALARESAEYAKMDKVLKGLQQRLAGAAKELDDVGKMQSLKRLREDFKLAESEAKVLAREFADMREQMLAIGKSGQLQKVNEELGKTEATAAQVRDEFKLLDEALALDPNSIEACVKRLTNLDEQANVTRRRIAQLQAKMDDLEAAGAKKSSASMEALADSAASARAKVERLSGELNEVNANLKLASTEASEFRKKLDISSAEKAEESVERLKAKAASLESQLEKAEHAFDSAYMTRELRKVENEIVHANAQLENFKTLAKSSSSGMASAFFAMRTAGYSLSSTVGVAVSSVGYAMVSKAEEIDAAFRDMKKTVNGTDEQFETLRQDAIEYSKTHVTSADTILEIEAMAGQLGIAASNLEEFSTTVSNLDIATNMDAEDIAIDLGKLSNVLGDLDESNVSNFADALVRLGNNNAALESDIMNITTRFGGMASQVGMSADEILAWGTAASATGVKAESAGSNMLKTLGNINGAVSAGGKKLDAWSKIIGMSADEVKKKWGDGKGGTNEVFKSFITTLSKMKKTDIDASLLGIGITSVRQRQLIEGLTQSVGNMDDVLKMSRDAWNGVSDEWGNAGDAAYEAQQKSEGFSGAIGMLRNNLAAIADQVGQDLVPYIQQATTALQQFSEWYSKLSSDDKDFFFKLAAGLAALGPALIGVGATGNMVKTAVGGVGALVGKMKAVNAKHLSKEAQHASKSMSSMAYAAVEGAAAAASVGAASKDAGSKMEQSAKSATTASKGYKVASKSAKGAASGVKAVSSAVGGSISYFSMGTAAISLLVVSLAAAAKTILDAKEEYDEFQSAVSGSNVADVFASWGVLPDATSKAAASIRELKEGTNSLVDSMNSHNEAAKETLKETALENSQLAKYGSTVEKVSKKVQKGKITKVSDLSDKELGQLQTALSAINEAMGTNYKPIDIIAKGQADEAKKVNSEIQKSIRLKQLAAQQEAMGSIYSDSLKDQMKAQEEYNKALQTVKEKQAKADEAYANGNSFDRMGANKELNEATAELNKNKLALDAATLSTEKYKEAQDFLGTAQAKGGKGLYGLISQTTSAFGTLAANGQLDSFTTALKSVGITYKGLTDDQKSNTDWLNQLAASYDGATASLVSGLDSLGVSYKATSADFAVAKENVKSALDTLGGDATAKLKESYGSVSSFLKVLDDAGYKVDQLKNLSPIKWETILNSSDFGSKAKGISDELKGALDSAIKESADASVKVDADTTEADKKISKTSKGVKDLNEQTAKPKADLDTSAFDTAASSVQSEISRLNGQTATVYIKTKKGGGGGGTWQGPVIQESSEPSRPVAFSAMSLDASRAVAQLDSAFASNQYAVSDVSSSVDEMASRSRKTYKAASSKQTAVLDSDAMAALKAIAKNTKGGKGLYLDGDKLVGGTAGRYDTTMARRERLAKRGLDI